MLYLKLVNQVGPKAIRSRTDIFVEGLIYLKTGWPGLGAYLNSFTTKLESHAGHSGSVLSLPDDCHGIMLALS